MKIAHFKNIPPGLFNIMTINKRLRSMVADVVAVAEAVERAATGIELLSEQVAELQDGAGIAGIPICAQEILDGTDSEPIEDVEPELPTDEPLDEEKTETETVTVEFDWRTTEDLDALKAWALETHGLSLVGNVKKIETARGQINEFLQTRPEK